MSITHTWKVAALTSLAICAAAAGSASAAAVNPVAAGVGEDGVPWQCTVHAAEPVREARLLRGPGLLHCAGSYPHGIGLEICLAKFDPTYGDLQAPAPFFRARSCAPAPVLHRSSRLLVLRGDATVGCDPLPVLTRKSTTAMAGVLPKAGAWVTYVTPSGGGMRSGDVSDPVAVDGC